MNTGIELRRGSLPRTRGWREEPWVVIIALASLLGIRPALSIADVFDRMAPPWGQIVVTVVVYTIWVVTMLVRHDPYPIRTLALAGAVYGVMVILVNPILWLVLGAPSLPTPAYVFAPVAVIGFNTLVGAVLGALVTGLRNLLKRP